MISPAVPDKISLETVLLVVQLQHVVQGDQSKDRFDADSVLQSQQPALTPLRSPPQRSLSSPDMSRFKFRLTLSKPPIHPTSSGKIRRQLSLTDSIDDDGALSKTTSDRHCEQERLFHQLEQTVLTSEVPRVAVSSQASGLQLKSAPVSKSESQLARTSSNLVMSTHSPSASMQLRPAVKHNTPSTLSNLVIHGPAAGLLDTNSDDVCQPSTPIRREDSIPVHADQQQLIGEAVFAALYEQTNVLLRNLHFERIQRRASTS